MHPRSIKQLHVENAQLLGKEKVFWLTHDFCELKGIDRIRGLMFRYIYPLDKHARKMLDSYEEYIGTKHPKEIDLVFERRIGAGHYENIPQPNFNMNVFIHNHQKYSTNPLAQEFFS